MRKIRQVAMLAGVMAVLAGCTYSRAIQQLSGPEQERFRIYAKVMSAGQTRHYLKQPTAAARTAYLQDIGLAQRFQALKQLDQEAVRDGQIRAGMSAEALRFLWGEPAYRAGDPDYYAYWYYHGSTWELARSGNVFGEIDTIVIVDLVDGKVDGWFETVPSIDGDDAGEDRDKN